VASPTLEVHVPISPTPAFLRMTHYLVRSLRANGGRYRDAPVILTVGDEAPLADLARAHPWLSALNVTLRGVDRESWTRESWYATACERFRYETTSDVVLMLDADTLIAAPIDDLVDEAHRTGALCGVVAHMPPLPSLDDWQTLYDACGLGPLQTPCEHTGWGYMFNDEALRYCPPYFNLGVLAAPASVMRRIGEDLYALMSTVDAVKRTPYRVQIAVSLAITRWRIPYRTLGMRWNFPNDPFLEAIHASEQEDVRIIHLLRRNQFYKDEVFASAEGVEALLARSDLRVINARAQHVLRSVHGGVQSDGD
jgi:hypothetical protein